MSDNAPSTAVLLVGGKATRLRPLTLKRPKGLLDVQGQSVVEHLLDLLKRHHVKNVILSTGYLKKQFRDYFGDGKKFGVNMLYAEEDEPLGTAGPLKLARKHLNSAFIMSNGDELKDINVEEMYKLHKKKKALATLALTEVKDPSHYGVARLKGNKILEFVEKPKKEDAPSNLINAGFYIIEPEVIKMIPKGFSMVEKDVFPQLAKKGRLYGYPFKGQWFDMGTHERYETTKKEWKGLFK